MNNEKRIMKNEKIILSLRLSLFLKRKNALFPFSTINYQLSTI